MAALTLAMFGDVPLAKNGVSETTEIIGDFARSFSGKARSDLRATPKSWVFTTVELDLSDAESLRDELLGAPPLTVSGDVVGGSIAVVPRNVRMTYGDDNGALTAVVSFELHADE